MQGTAGADEAMEEANLGSWKLPAPASSSWYATAGDSAAEAGPSVSSGLPRPSLSSSSSTTVSSASSIRGKRSTKGNVPNACAHCKKAHLACDLERPCKRCVTLGKDPDSCVNVQHKKRGRPRLRSRNSAEGGELQEQLSTLSRAPPSTSSHHQCMLLAQLPPLVTSMGTDAGRIAPSPRYSPYDAPKLVPRHSDPSSLGAPSAFAGMSAPIANARGKLSRSRSLLSPGDHVILPPLVPMASSYDTTADHHRGLRVTAVPSGYSTPPERIVPPPSLSPIACSANTVPWHPESRLPNTEPHGPAVNASKRRSLAAFDDRVATRQVNAPASSSRVTSSEASAWLPNARTQGAYPAPTTRTLPSHSTAYGSRVLPAEGYSSAPARPPPRFPTSSSNLALSSTQPRPHLAAEDVDDVDLVGLLVCTTGLVCLRSSEELRALLGYSERDLVEMSLHSILHPSDGPKLERLCADLLSPVGIPAMAILPRSATIDVRAADADQLAVPAAGTIFPSSQMRLISADSSVLDFVVQLHLGAYLGLELHQPSTLSRSDKCGGQRPRRLRTTEASFSPSTQRIGALGTAPNRIFVTSRIA
ncbi:hypothetical protein K437DRAFT_263847 [Tilletiaria anomala UBC 951]|uniref:Transcription activator of gluconeogenesis ERT1 n=1 Tax=Tilletiaria anomala (strain ATCC 24038 / CBS 436.72 / UBC 951) TaxID=1037660 RepID=A0A066VK01_TILAU|nr:uncharacterized protein K437DRAFT_263847 [Tilletiaria anomala UBC 951]KDN42067.1 hypothetical protein K437DRAFT_263847 [Tilletiaria anomala UBC 951]